MRMSMPKAWYTAMQTPQYTDDRLPNLYTMHACMLGCQSASDQKQHHYVIIAYLL